MSKKNADGEETVASTEPVCGRRLAFISWTIHPEEPIFIAGEVLHGWLSDMRMALEKWEREIRTVIRKVFAAKAGQWNKLR